MLSWRSGFLHFRVHPEIPWAQHLAVHKSAYIRVEIIEPERVVFSWKATSIFLTSNVMM